MHKEVKQLGDSAGQDINNHIMPLVAKWQDSEISFPFVLMMTLVAQVRQEGWGREELLSDIGTAYDLDVEINGGTKH